MASRLVFQNPEKTLRIRFSEGRYTLESQPRNRPMHTVELDEAAMDALADAWPRLRESVQRGFQG